MNDCFCPVEKLHSSAAFHDEGQWQGVQDGQIKGRVTATSERGRNDKRQKGPSRCSCKVERNAKEDD